MVQQPRGDDDKGCTDELALKLALEKAKTAKIQAETDKLNAEIHLMEVKAKTNKAAMITVLLAIVAAFVFVAVMAVL